MAGPAAQTAQPVDAFRSWSYDPAAHAVHSLADALLQLPSSQALQRVPCALMLPAGHGLQPVFAVIDSIKADRKKT